MILLINILLIQCSLSIKFEKPVEECAVNDKHLHRKQFPSVPQRRQYKSEITVEIGVYFDIYLRQKFNNNDSEVENYIKVLMSGTQNVFRYPTMRSTVNLIVTRFEMVPNNSVPYVHNLIVYHDTFCKWQSERMQSRLNYDLAILFTSKNIYLNDSRGSKNGYAPISRVCPSKNYPNDNCALVKATYVNSMWTIAHEIGHKLGITHDEKHCGAFGVMAPISQEPYHWTQCSNDYLEIFIASRAFSGCLFKRSGQELKGWKLNSVNFHSFSMEDQCAINFGPKYKPYPLMIEVCLALPCIYDLLEPLNAGAPLEQTVCRNKTLNFDGKCVRSKCVK